jgi:hypothetical protein
MFAKFSRQSLNFAKVKAFGKTAKFRTLAIIFTQMSRLYDILVNYLLIYFFHLCKNRQEKYTFAYFRESVRQSCRFFQMFYFSKVIFEYMRRPRKCT